MQRLKTLKSAPFPGEHEPGFFLLTRDERGNHAEEIRITGIQYTLFRALSDGPRHALISVLQGGKKPGVIIKGLTLRQWRDAVKATTMSPDSSLPPSPAFARPPGR